MLLKIKKILNLILGQLSWNPPHWIAKPIRFLTKKISSFKKKNPRPFWFMLLGSILLATLIYPTLIWYRHRPQPVWTQVSLANPTISSITSYGIIPSSLFIRFNGSAAQLTDIGQSPGDKVSLSPAIEGSWKWTSDRVLQFTPKADWPANQEYKVSFKKNLFPPQIHLKEYDYSFRSPDFTAKITHIYFYQDPVDPQKKQIVASINFTHPILPADFESHVQLQEITSKEDDSAPPLKITVTYDPHFRNAYITSEIITPTAKERFAKLVITKGLHPQDNASAVSKVETTVSVNIPSISTFFSVNDVESSIAKDDETQKLQQILVIATKDKIAQKELAKHLVVYLLPKDKPATEEEAEKDYKWESASEVTPEILSASQEIKLTPISSETDGSFTQSFSYQQPEGRFLYVTVVKGAKSFGGYVLSDDANFIVPTATYPREVSLLYQGSLLSLSGERKLPYLVRGVKDVKLNFYRVRPEEINHLVSMTDNNSSFSDPSFSSYRFNEENISELSTEIQSFDNTDPSVIHYGVIDFGKHVQSQKGLFLMDVGELNGQSVPSIQDRRLILVTDLGLIIKDTADGTHTVFVTSLSTGKPVEGVVVEVMGKNGLPLLSSRTDASGKAVLNDFSTFKNEQTPVAYIAKKGNDLAFFRINHQKQHVNYYNFDNGGLHLWGKTTLMASLFTDRDIYRPGEKMVGGVLVRRSDWTQSESIPLSVIITNPNGRQVSEQKIQLPDSGFFETSYQTSDENPTGTYTWEVRLPGTNKEDGSEPIGSGTFRVEDFVPDNMKIKSRLSVDIAEDFLGWISPKDLKGLVQLDNLYGTAASDRRVTGALSLTPVYPHFTSYDDYTFYNPLVLQNETLLDLVPDVTDEKGAASFDFDLRDEHLATYRLSFIAKGFSSDSGRSVTAISQALVSPLEWMIGYKDDGDNLITRGSTHSINFIAVNPQLQKIDLSSLTMRIVEKKYISTLVKNDDGTYHYKSLLKEEELSQKDFSISKDGSSFTLPTDQPGKFIIRLFKEDSKVAELYFSVASDANLTRSLDKNAELIVSLNQKSYNPGDDIEISISAPYVGSGLITIERDKVYASQWFTATTTHSVQKIKLPADFNGNGYINVMMARSKNSDQIFMNPFSYALAPFSMNLEKRKLAIDLNVPQLIKPGETLPIRYKTSRPSHIVIYAVDEGILNYAGYVLPNPLSFFYTKRALEVETYQNLDLILPEYSQFKNTAAPGGDGDVEKNAVNPFKRKGEPPVVYWSGIIDADATEKELSFTAPDYFNGSLRIMAVAMDDQGIGTQEKITKVRGPLVLTANTPLFVTPGDVFEVGLTIANNVKGSGTNAEVSVSVSPSNGLKMEGETQTKIVIPENTEKFVTFKAKAEDILGETHLNFTATQGEAHVERHASLSIRPASVYQTTLTHGYLKSGKKTVELTRKIYAEKSILKAVVSPLPLSFAYGLAQYLEKYPYGCTEQLISQAFPALFLKSHPELENEPGAAEKTLMRIIEKLKTRQENGGFFGIWHAGSNQNVEYESDEENTEDEEDTENSQPIITASSTSQFLTLYALHFFLDAREQGVIIPDGLFDNTLEAVKKIVQQTPENQAAARLYSYAAYLLTRNGMVTSNYIANIRNYLENSDEEWNSTLTGAYLAATYQLLKQDKEASQLLSAYSMGKDKLADDYFLSSTISDAQYFYILSRHFPQKIASVKTETLLALVDPLMQNHFNTLSSSYLLMALQAYADKVSVPSADSISVTATLKGKETSLELKGHWIQTASFPLESEKLTFAAKNNTPLFYQVVESGFDQKFSKTIVTDGIEILRQYQNNKGESLTSTSLGEEISVKLTLRSTDGQAHPNVAVIDLLPAGFELSEPQLIIQGENGISGSTAWSIDNSHVREDRVLLFGEVDETAKEFVYHIHSVNQGVYQIPPAVAEGMYDLDIKAMTAANTLTVTSPE